MTDPKVPLVPLSATPPSQPDDLPPAPVAAGTPDATIALKLYPPGPVPAMPNRRRNLVAKMAQRRAINRR